MWIRTLDPEAPDYAQREERYARRLRRLRKRLRGRAYEWLLDDKLHDATLIGLSIDEVTHEVYLGFDYVGAGIRRGERWLRAKTQRLRFSFRGVSEFEIEMPVPGKVCLKGADYIIGELNTSPNIRRRLGTCSVAMVLSNEEEVHIRFAFKKVSLREELLPPGTEA